jgi:hypothetical protein
VIFALNALLAATLAGSGSQLVRFGALMLLVAVGLAAYLGGLQVLGVARLRDLIRAVREGT